MTLSLHKSGKRGQLARAFAFGAALLFTACAGAPGREVVALRPSPQQQPTHQVVGETIVASLGGAAVSVQWLGAKAVEQFYAARPGLAYPWPREVWKETPPTVFFLRLRNQTRDEIQFDPTLVALVTPDGRRERSFSYEEMHERLAGTEGGGPRLLSLQATLFSRFIVIPPGGQREGLLVFPTLQPGTKHAILELASFFVGGRTAPGLFEFQVISQ